MIGVRVGLEKESVGACGGRGIQERWNEFPQAAARAVGSLTRLLHRVRGVEHDRYAARGAEAGEVPHVDHQVAVPEKGASLGDRDLGCPAGAHLVHSPGHPLGGHPLALLHVHGPPGTTRRDEQIGLPAQERGDLQDVRDLGRGRHVAGLVDVGEDREAGSRADSLEGLEPALETGAPPCPDPRPVRLVVGRLVDDVHAELRRELAQGLADSQVQVVGFDDAGPRDEERGRSSPEMGRHVSRGGRRAGTGRERAAPARCARLLLPGAESAPRR